MKKSLSVIVISVLCLTAFICGAAEKSLKVAVVRIQDAFSEYDKTKAMKKNIEATFKPDQKAIDNLRKKIESLKKELRTDTLTEPRSFRHFEKIQSIRTKEYLLKTMNEDLRREWNERMIEFYKTVYADFQKAVKEYAQKNGYDLVLRKADDALSNKSAMGIQNEIGLKIIHYASPGLDSTAAIIEIMNRNWRKAKATRKKARK